MTMTIRDRVKMALDNCAYEKDNLDKLISLAYYMGKEEATKELSDKYSAVLAEQKKRAEACRYHNMAAAIVGNVGYIYSDDYAGDMSGTFGDDKTDL